MMLKKQTVWLLTMLSLIIVLSVYYMTSEPPSPGQMAITDQEEEEESGQEAEDSKSGDVTEGETASSEITDDSGFTAFEMERADTRSQQLQQYTDVIASSSTSAEEKAAAQEKKEQLQELTASEQVLESLLEANGYQAALVNTDGKNVNVIVKTDHQSTKQANEIILLTEEHLGADKKVAVTFQLVK